MRIRWGKVAGQLGILYCLAGLFLVFLGWNGAATYNSTAAQIPYVISGGLAGLSLVVIGGSLMVAQASKSERASLEEGLAELRDAVDRLAAGAAAGGGGAGAGPGAPAPAAAVAAAGTGATVVAGPTAYHRPDCRLVEGQSGVVTMASSAAVDQGLAPCRVCAPDAA